MKKDIEWIISEIGQRVENVEDHEKTAAYNKGVARGLEISLSLLDQLDKPETLSIDKEQLIKSIENYNTLYDETVGDVVEGILETVKQLPEMEVLSPDWIDENQHPYGGDYQVPSEKLENLLVPKQEDMFNGEKPDEGEVYFAIGLGGAVEINVARNINEAIEILTKHETNYTVSKKPEIPKFIAEVIEEDKEAGCDVYDSIYLIIETNGGGVLSISDWVARNIDKYARAWLAYPNIEVEKEQKYVVKIPTNENNDIPYAIVSDSGDIWIDALPSKYKLTEEEIRGLTKGDVLFEHFAVKVEVWEE